MTIISTILTKLAAALASLSMLLGLTHAPVATTTAPVVINTSPAGLIPAGAMNNSSVSATHQFTDKNWSLAFTLRPEWNVNEILGMDNTLHQMQISGSAQAIFISKNEAIGLSNDLTFTTATRTIAGQSVEVRTYTKPSAAYAYYQLFTIKQSDATYSFFLKSTTLDTAVTEAFIKSIVQK